MSTAPARLGNPQNALRQAFDSFAEVSSSLEKAYLDLQDRVQQLEKRMRQAERLAAMGEMALEVAHEIRNPLTSLGLFASLLRDSGLDEIERNRCVDQIEIGISTLDNTLSNLLTFFGDRELEKSLVAPADLLAETLDLMAPVLEERGIGVQRRLDDRSRVNADPDLLRQVFMNLVLNAVQALPCQGRIEVESSSSPDEAIVSVRDSGIGLAEEVRERLFEPHFATTDKGNGLGLGVVKKIVEEHSGRLEVQSRRDWGTRFVLAFPVGAETR